MRACRGRKNKKDLEASMRNEDNRRYTMSPRVSCRVHVSRTENMNSQKINGSDVLRSEKKRDVKKTMVTAEGREV